MSIVSVAEKMSIVSVAEKMSMASLTKIKSELEYYRTSNLLKIIIIIFSISINMRF
jgi:hypothetical protein